VGVRFVAPLFAAVGVGLAVWTAYVAYELPPNHLARNWDVAWTGFDAALVALMFSVAYGVARGRRWLPAVAGATAALLLTDGAAGHRSILREYSPYLLDQMISVVTAATLVAYSLYTFSSETAERLGSDRLGLTISFVLYGIFRYLYLVHQRNEGGSPSELLLTDRPLLVCVALWAAAVVLVLYSPLGD